MKLAVLSGKGGTGKTLVSVNLAASMAESMYLDCDVEAPNGRLFFRPEEVRFSPVMVKIPVVDRDLCIGCRTCTEFCRFNAMAFIGSKVKIFEDVCHSCGGCSILCPAGAITENDRRVGHIEQGRSEQVRVATGVMDIGEISGVPIIEELIKLGKTHQGPVVIDCPPGSACVVMESIKEADFCIIVAEPTVFGLHNMTMVHELVRKMNKPCGLIINKSYGNDRMILEYCNRAHLPIMGVIGYDEELAGMGSLGSIAVREEVRYRKLFTQMLNRLEKEIAYETVAGSKR